VLVARAALVLCLLVSIRPTLALAQATDALDEAETAAGEGDFERAIQLLTAATHERDRHAADLARAYTLLGVVQATLGDDAAAATAFEWALALDPGMPTPPELGPTQRQMLDRLRAARRGRSLAVTLDAPPDASVDDTVQLEARADGAPEGTSLVVTITAWPDDDETVALTADGAGSTTLRIPAGAWPNAHEIHVRAEATADGGPALAYRDERVRRRMASGGGGGSVFEEAWFWVVVGVVVAGGVTAAVVVTQVPQAPTLGRPELVP
jgi:hypothetical protein